mgnify:CR=1 FL=1
MLSPLAINLADSNVLFSPMELNSENNNVILKTMELDSGIQFHYTEYTTILSVNQFQ